MSEQASSSPSLHAVSPAERLMSLDALRGFDMMWIVGADALGEALAKMNLGPALGRLTLQLHHVKWEGFRFYDLIFPLFVFLIGVAITFSLGKLVAREGRQVAVWRVLRRTLLLYVLGLLYYGGMSKGFDQIRWVGVLQRLALCYGVTGLAYIYFKPSTLWGITAGLLAGYWALLTFVPAPGFSAGDFAEGHNLTNWFDQYYLPGRKWDTTHDPEGVLSTFPAIASCLLGVFAGQHLQNLRITGDGRAGRLALAGLVLLGMGYLWGLQFPIIKKLWSSSFVLVAGGWSALLLAAFYYLIDVRQIRGWAMPFVWIGTNALTIYLISNVVDFDALSKRFAGGEIAAWLDAHVASQLSGVVIALVGLALCFLFCRFLYRRQVFLRL